MDGEPMPDHRQVAQDLDLRLQHRLHDGIKRLVVERLQQAVDAAATSAIVAEADAARADPTWTLPWPSWSMKISGSVGG